MDLFEELEERYTSLIREVESCVEDVVESFEDRKKVLLEELKSKKEQKILQIENFTNQNEGDSAVRPVVEFGVLTGRHLFMDNLTQFQIVPLTRYSSGDQLTVTQASNLNSQGKFLVRVEDEVQMDYLTSLSYRLNAEMSSGDCQLHPSPHPGAVCCSRYSADGKWYRAKVIEPVGKTKVKILFLDYGNIEEVLTEDIYKLHEKYLLHPFHIMECCFSEENSFYQREAKWCFNDTVQQQSLSLTIIKHLKTGTDEVGTYVVELLNEHKINVGQKVLAVVCQLKATGKQPHPILHHDIRVKKGSTKPPAEQGKPLRILKRLKEYSSDPPTLDPPTSDPPKSDPPTSDPPTSDPPKSDPPTSDPPTSDPPTSDPPTSDPPTSDPPTSDPPTSDPPTSDPPTSDPPKSDPPTSDPPKSDPPTSDPPKSDPPTSDPPKSDPPTSDPPTSDPPKSDPPTSDPSTSDPPTSDPPKSSTTVPSVDPDHSPPLPPSAGSIALHPAVHTGNQVSLIVMSELGRDGIFWAQVATSPDSEDRYKAMTEHLQICVQDFFDYHNLKWEKSDLCCARFSEDKLWYRALVEHGPLEAGQGIGVRFLDFGNSEVLSTRYLRPLPLEHRDLPQHSVHCKLVGDSDQTYSKVMREKFDDLTANSTEVPITAEICDISGDHVSVKLLLLSGDKSINLNDEIVLSDSTKFESIMFGQSDKMSWADQMDELSSPSALKKDVGFFEEEEKELSKVTKNADIEWYSTSELKGESLSFRSNKSKSEKGNQDHPSRSRNGRGNSSQHRSRPAHLKPNQLFNKAFRQAQSDGRKHHRRSGRGVAKETEDWEAETKSRRSPAPSQSHNLVSKQLPKSSERT